MTRVRANVRRRRALRLASGYGDPEESEMRRQTSTGYEPGCRIRGEKLQAPSAVRVAAIAMFWILMACLSLPSAVAQIALVPGNSHGRVSDELSHKMQTAGPTSTFDVIVQFRKAPGKGQDDKVAAEGGSTTQHLGFIKGAAYHLTLKSLKRLAKDSDVVYISPDRPVTRSLDYVQKAVNADVAWSYGYDGSGVGIAIIDSGIYQHRDLYTPGTNTSRVVYSQSFLPSDSTTSDAYGHGTHVAGIAAGDGQSSQYGYPGDYKGMAPNASIVNLRALDANGSGTDSTVIAAIQRAVQLKSQYNIRVINLSLGRPVYESYTLDPLCQAVEQAWQSGIVVVVAAGNSGRDNSYGTHGYGTIASPGNDPYVITVGAMDMHNSYIRSDDTIASYSSKGPTLIDHVVKPDLVAPGNRIVSLLDPNGTLEANYPKYDIYPSSCSECSPRYFRLSGTSMATPVVSGAAALMIQKDPTLTPDLVKARLMKTAYKGFAGNSTSTDAWGNIYTNQVDLFTYGAGYVDIAAALANTDTGSGLALSPTAVYNPATGTVTLSFTTGGTSVTWGTSLLWGSSVLWGSSLVWGADVVSGNSLLWGSSVVWGTSTTSGFSLLWGSSVIWGASTSTALTDGEPGDCEIDPTTGLAVCQ